MKQQTIQDGTEITAQDTQVKEWCIKCGCERGERKHIPGRRSGGIQDGICGCDCQEFTRINPNIREASPAPVVGLVPQTPMGLLGLALQNNAAIDVIERLAALQEKAQARDAEVQFNEAMNAVQSELGRIAPDLTNPQTHSKYASYAALDRVLRPVYVRHGFSLSFDSGESSPETVRAYCYVSHKAGHTRRYQSPDMPADGKGAKGGDVMTKTHATGSAMSYAMRYLLKYIFNVAIGADDNDGNGTERESGWAKELDERLKFFPKCSTLQELEDHYRASYLEAKGRKDQVAMDAIIFAKNTRKSELAK